MIARAILLCAVALAMAAPSRAQAPQDCTLKIISALDFQMTDDGRITIPVTLNNKPFRMLVDTGDDYSVITAHAAKALGIEPLYVSNLYLEMWGGAVVNQSVDLNEFGLGGQKRGYTQFMVMQTRARDIDGLFGADFQDLFDLDFDMAHAKLNLISPNRCKGQVVYWTKGSYAAIPFDYKDRKIVLDVTLDGKEVTATLDTGSVDTVLSLEKAADLFDWDDKTTAKAAEHYAFKTLSFGGVTVDNPDVGLVPDKDSVLLGHGVPRMIIGMDIMRRLHFVVSYKEKTLYVTPAEQY